MGHGRGLMIISFSVLLILNLQLLSRLHTKIKLNSWYFSSWDHLSMRTKGMTQQSRKTHMSAVSIGCRVPMGKGPQGYFYFPSPRLCSNAKGLYPIQLMAILQFIFIGKNVEECSFFPSILSSYGLRPKSRLNIKCCLLIW